MATLNPDALQVSSFDTGTTSSSYITEGDNCMSPLCMTEDQACTTPWCPPKPPQPITG